MTVIMQIPYMEINDESSSKKSFRKIPGSLFGSAAKAFEGDCFPGPQIRYISEKAQTRLEKNSPKSPDG